MYRHRFALLSLWILTASVGCASAHLPFRKDSTPAQAGINSRDLIDPVAQRESDRLLDIGNLIEVSNEVKQMQVARATQADPGFASRPPRNVLCLSGGGSYGAFSAGILYGWSQTGQRPVFDTVTGISTGALIAPLAFLGSKYDEELKRFYTEIHTRDIYVLHPIRGLLRNAIADNTALGKKIEGVLSEQLISELAQEHHKGRRLYVGTTELEGKRFVVWDLGAIACRDGFAGRNLMKRILLGSSAIPGFFPPSEIPVTVDGQQLTEKHGDGGVSQGIFFRPPYSPETATTANSGAPLAGTKVWCVVAGKLYADPAPLKTYSIGIASTSVAAVIYSQTRGDLLRIYTSTVLAGMDYNLTSIPEGFEAPKSSTDFDADSMTKMFQEGVRLIQSGTAWRNTAPGGEPGETVRERAGTQLTEWKMGPRVNTRTGEHVGTPGMLMLPSLPLTPLKAEK